MPDFRLEFLILDFMAALSDPGGFSKAAEKQSETMKNLGIEQTDSKAEAKKKKEEEAKRGNKVIRTIRFFYVGLKNNIRSNDNGEKKLY